MQLETASAINFGQHPDTVQSFSLNENIIIKSLQQIVYGNEKNNCY